VLTNRALTRVAAYWSFIVIGAGNVFLGPALSPLMVAFHVSPSASGLLFIASTLGYLVGVLVGGPSGDRWGRRAVLLTGAVLYGLGLAAFGLAEAWGAIVAAMFVMGAGGGVLDSGSNALINDLAAPSKHAMEQNLLHTFFGIGALIGPLLIGASLAAHGGWRPAYLIGAAGSLVLVLLLARVRLPRPEPRASSASVGPRTVLAMAGHPLILLLGLMIGAYTGAEVLVGDWAATYLHQIQHLDAVAAATSVSLFWGGLAGGRLLSAILSRWLSGHVLLIGTSALSLIATTALVLAPSAPVALIALAAAGLGFAAIFPLVMALAGEVFPDATGSVAGLLIACASLAGAAFPWLAGVLVQYANARVALIPPIAASLLLVVMALRPQQPRGTGHDRQEYGLGMDPDGTPSRAHGHG
jgi:fucose permease